MVNTFIDYIQYILRDMSSWIIFCIRYLGVPILIVQVLVFFWMLIFYKKEILKWRELVFKQATTFIFFSVATVVSKHLYTLFSGIIIKILEWIVYKGNESLEYIIGGFFTSIIMIVFTAVVGCIVWVIDIVLKIIVTKGIPLFGCYRFFRLIFDTMNECKKLDEEVKKEKIKLKQQEEQKIINRILDEQVKLSAYVTKEVNELIAKLIPIQERKEYISSVIKVDNCERYNYYKELETELEKLYDIKNIFSINDFLDKYEDIHIKRDKYLQDLKNRYTYLIDRGRLFFYFNVENLERYCNLQKSTKKELHELIKQVTSDYRICTLGKKGEDIVNKELEMYDDIINLCNIRIEVEGQSIENDNILITRNGIFVIEVKNYGSTGKYNLVIERDGRWSKCYANGEREEIKSATQQNNRHIAYLSRLINTEMHTSFDNRIPVYGLVIIPNNTITIENNNKLQDVYRVSELYAFTQSKPEILKYEQIKQIQQIIEANNLPGIKYDLQDVHHILVDKLKGFVKLEQEFPEHIFKEIDDRLAQFEQEKNALAEK